MLARWLREHVPSPQILELKLRLGDLPAHRAVTPSQFAELKELVLPLPSSRMSLEDTDPRKHLLQQTLQDEGLQEEQFKLKGIRTMFFSRGERPALCMPVNLQHESGPDALNEGKQKLIFSCELPRGSYATLIVKRVQAGCNLPFRAR
jgi:tRNA pseudouridine13 synthase